jgi:hypothetical protein
LLGKRAGQNTQKISARCLRDSQHGEGKTLKAQEQGRS